IGVGQFHVLADAEVQRTLQIELSSRLVRPLIVDDVLEDCLHNVAEKKCCCRWVLLAIDLASLFQELRHQRVVDLLYGIPKTRAGLRCRTAARLPGCASPRPAAA